MPTGKKRRGKPAAREIKHPPVGAGSAQIPAWRGRLGLIIGFFTLTIGLGILYLAYEQWVRQAGIKTYGFTVRAKYLHDSNAFTEGLVWHDGKLFESTGLEGKSSIRVTDLQSSDVRIEPLDVNVFGEGLTLWRDRLIQLTYNEEVAYTYDLDLVRQEQTYSYEGQGWGLTHDGRFLIMSNGTNELQFRDPETFELDHRLPVTIGGRRIGRLNELEYANGRIYANVWHDDSILEIDPADGKVTGRIELRDLLPRDQRPSHPEAVLNGIAYNQTTKRLIVTGKYWPYFFEIELVPKE
jgi:glutamine cyclotransferase